MNKSSFGSHFTVTTWGESHGKALGAVIDGCPAGLSLSEEDIQKFLDRRKPGQNRYTTARKEGDLVEILSGVFEGKTTGTPLCAIIENTDTRSRDYQPDLPRPGHGDYAGFIRYGGCNDYRGGGHFSGRLTAPLVFAGAMCKLFLKSKGITVGSHIASVGQIMDTPFDDINIPAEQLETLRTQAYPVINPRAQQAMLDLIELARDYWTRVK